MLDAMATGSVSAAMGRNWVTGALVCRGTDIAPTCSQRHVDGRVVDARESEDRDAVTGPHRVRVSTRPRPH